MIFIKYDPIIGEPIPDGIAENYAKDIARHSKEVVDYDRHFSVSSLLMIHFLRVLVLEGEANSKQMIIRFPSCPDQVILENGRLNHWPNVDFFEEALDRLLQI